MAFWIGNGNKQMLPSFSPKSDAMITVDLRLYVVQGDVPRSVEHGCFCRWCPMFMYWHVKRWLRCTLFYFLYNFVRLWFTRQRQLWAHPWHMPKNLWGVFSSHSLFTHPSRVIESERNQTLISAQYIWKKIKVIRLLIILSMWRYKSWGNKPTSQTGVCPIPPLSGLCVWWRKVRRLTGGYSCRSRSFGSLQRSVPLHSLHLGGFRD